MNQAAPPLTSPQPGSVRHRVVLDDDATPMARLIARRLRTWCEEHRPEPHAQAGGWVVVRSHDTPQLAAIHVGPGEWRVSNAIPEQPHADMTVALNARLSPVQPPSGNTSLAEPLVVALTAPPGAWRETAAEFWECTRDITGIPDVLVVQAHGSLGVDELRLGAGPVEYGIAGSPDQLAGVFSGVDDIFTALESGLTIKGTLAQLSVMTAASWRVRYGF
ncbi:hypothetical protein [Aeromicrobium sp. Leaf350]|uniref:hypothetical protein n=1 Tax=Aeromicrobium sp. Leaf350 TaxID=2876565 RepID=UPI001E2B4CC7|nr:hypothetical protein [Aeromicrobium sp. Leaf350]